MFDGDVSPEVARSVRAAGVVAVDTETSGLDWRADQLQLSQLFTPQTGPVFIRNVTGHPSALAEVLGDPGVLKVFHFAPFDLRFLEAGWDVRVSAAACTKAASKILQPTLPAHEHSVQPLLRRTIGVEMSKGSVRTSDWGAGDLSAPGQACGDGCRVRGRHGGSWFVPAYE
ncbi:3'-5' exonuclease family protein [Occultella aeris]|uniref:hypothetical protein n=1 Tax=Occultella aeris TaxID=2761496 RepID=UPI0038CD84A8